MGPMPARLSLERAVVSRLARNVGRTKMAYRRKDIAKLHDSVSLISLSSTITTATTRRFHMRAIIRLLAGQTLCLFFAFVAADAEEATVPDFASLHLETWSPQNNLRPIKNLRTDGGAAVGFNEELIWGYMQSAGVVCRDCPGNSPPVKLEAADNYLEVLSKNDIRIMRELIPERYVADASKYAFFEPILKEYERRDFALIFTLNWPVARARAPCFGFDGDGATFDRVAYEYSASIAGLLLYLRNRSGIDPKWLETHVLIEPWSEFDGLCGHRVGSPEKAARYQGIMQLVFDRAGIKNEVTMPSVVNTYTFGVPNAIKGKYGKMSTYIASYYASGGSGRPNIHLYFDPRWEKQPEALANILGRELVEITQSVAKPYRDAVLIGETGVNVRSNVAKCNVFAISSTSQALLYKALIDSVDINRVAQMLLFWRLFGLEHLTANPDSCAQFNGMTGNAWSQVVNPEQALGTFTQTGLDVLRTVRERR